MYSTPVLGATNKWGPLLVLSGAESNFFKAKMTQCK